MSTVAIIGAGPAGIATAIQLKRFGFDPMVFESGQIGGLLRNANLVENYPGYPGGIAGIDLVKLMKDQFLGHDISLKNEHVQKINFDHEKDQFDLKTSDGNYISDYLIIASGTRPNELTGFDEIASDLHYEIKELIGIKNNHILIIGAGDAALDYAINLSDNNRVTILNRGEEKKYLPLLWERCKKIESIEYYENTELLSASKIETHIKFIVNMNGVEKEIIADKLLVAIGRVPETTFLNKKFLQKIDELISKERLYFIGDVNNDIYRQTSIAVGNGVFAAMKIYQKVLEGSA